MNRFQQTIAPALPNGDRAELRPPAYEPEPPRNFEELKVSHAVLWDLMLRHLRMQGSTSFRSLSGTMKVSTQIVQLLFEEMRQQKLLHVKGSEGFDYSFELTDSGRRLAAERSERSRYTGPVPVSLEEYSHAVRLQIPNVRVNRAALKNALSDLVVPDSLLDQLGPALVSQRSLFLYGPTGNGKTSYSERLTRVYQDLIVIPYALEVDGQIITIYDPVVHHKVAIADTNLDGRWVVCRRPCITVGGELVTSMLDLNFDQTSGVYVAPFQVKANNGILVIDDFGRQVISPRQLLNRCMTPLDRRVDYLSLSYGTKFEIPIELLVVFSTNLNPADLADDAFLRRIPNKVYVADVDDQSFDLIFKREATRLDVPGDEMTAQTVRELCRLHGGGSLRACYPGDICRILHWISEYEGRPIDVEKSQLERAVQLYFARN